MTLPIASPRGSFRRIPSGKPFNAMKFLYINGTASAKDIAKGIGIKSKEVFPYLKRWMKRGIVQSRKLGNKRDYWLNVKHSFYKIIGYLIDHEDEIITSTEAERKRIMKKLIDKYNLKPDEIAILVELIEYAKETKQTRIEVGEFYNKLVTERNFATLLPGKRWTLENYLNRISEKTYRAVSLHDNVIYISKRLLEL